MTTDGSGPRVSGRVFFSPLDENGHPIGERRQLGHTVDVPYDRATDVGAGIWYHSTTNVPWDARMDEEGNLEVNPNGPNAEALAAAMGISAERAASAMMEMANRLDRTRVDLERARERTRRNRERLEELQRRQVGVVGTRQYLDETPTPAEECTHTSFYRMGHWRCASCNEHVCVDKNKEGGDCDPNIEYGAPALEWHKYRRPQGEEDLP